MYIRELIGNFEFDPKPPNCQLNKCIYYIEKKVSLWLLYGVQHSVIMADFIMPETQQPIIVIILIIYSPYLSKDLVEL